MARIPEETINRIKQDISLLRLVESQGYQVTRQGKDSVVRCPFHEDKTPSCVISPKTNLFNCFGCGAGGSVIDWVMKTQSVSFRFACEILQKDLGLVADSGGSAPKARNTTTKLPPPLAAEADHQTALRQVIDYYHETLKQSPEALDYLRSRGLDNPELIERFKLGYANRTLGYRLPERNRKAGAELRGKLQAIGILRESGHEHFNGSLVVPVMDENGTITEVYGRKLLDNLRKGTPKHTYLPGPHEGVWNIEALQVSKEIILCEALIDAMTFWVHGFRHVTASYGTGGFTASHLAAFKQHGTERVLIAYDRDDAGNKAAGVLAKQLQAEGIECFRVLLPKGMDVNEYAQQVTPPQKSLGLVLRKAEWMGNGKAPERQLELASEVPDFDHKRVPSLAAAGVIEEHTETLLATKTPIKPALNEPPHDNTLDQQATPVPALPSSSVAVQHGDNELFMTLGDRLYRVRGLDKNSSADQLKIQLLAKKDELFHMDKLDLYSSKQRQVFINQASVELGVKDEVIKKDLGKVLLTLEEQQAKQQSENPETKPAELEPEDRKAALELLRDPDLLNRILSDFSRCGVVGEETNKLVGYLAAGSRKLDRPLAVILQSTSAAGKSSLMDAVLNLMPEDERVQYSAMTGQSLFYMGETNLKHKILAIAEEEGASNASYALKLLQSEGEITIASTGKDDTTGNLVTKEYRVEGPVMLFLTTTAIDIDEELLNRCLVLTVNESREQTRAIHEAQRTRRTLKGLQGKLEKELLVKLHRNAQKLLRPLAVINPYADQLTFLDDKTRTRRDHEKYLTLIDSIALLHQYQREIKTVSHAGKELEYIEVQLSDIETANRLAHEILGRTVDELPPQTRKLLKLIQQMVRETCDKQRIEQSDFRFSRRDVREYTGWSDGQLKIHCTRLTDLEYLLVHRGGRGQHLVYELLFDGSDDDQPQLMGLIDPEKLGYDAQKSGVKARKSAPSQAQVSPKSDPAKPPQPLNGKGYRQSGPVDAESVLQAV
ncbi:MAG: CHC2 zinc finger domain-containing protein [Parahaliea sp.]